MGNRSWIVVIVVVLAILLVCCCVGTTATVLLTQASSSTVREAIEGIRPGSGARVSSEVVLRLEPRPLLRVNNKVGEVLVRRTDGDQVLVQATLKSRARSESRAHALLAQVQIDADSNENETWVTVDLPDTQVSEGVSVDLDIAVPWRTNLSIVNRVGKVTVNHIEGIVDIHTNVGEVQLQDMTLWPGSTVETNVGDIRFQGQLAPDSQTNTAEPTITFSTRVGKVFLELPADSSFILDANANVGDIHNEFELKEGETSERSGANQWLRGIVGTNPRTRLVVQAGTGTIDIRKWD